MTAILPTLPGIPDSRGLGGLLALARRDEVRFPLRSVRVRTTITGTVARTVVEQHFANPLDQPMEAIHIFPLPEDGAVIEMELRCGETVVRAECRERQDAEDRFASARTAGHRAALLTQERADVHTLRVTNLPPREDVRVRLVIVEQLEAEDGLLRFRFPTTLAPRYMPGRPQRHAGPGTHPDTDHVPDASRLSPPLRLRGGTLLDIEVRFDRPPAKLASSLHALQLSFDAGLVVAPNGSATCDRDFVLAFARAQNNETGISSWTDGEHSLVVIEPPILTQAAIPRDAVFVVDISGSMGGTKMEAAKVALRTALRGLNPGDRFRLLAFDDRVEALHRDFLPFDDGNLRLAEAFVDKLHARGGTEMVEPLVQAFSGGRPVDRLRTVLFITDGQAGNDVECLAIIANQARGARLFPLGIDTAVNGNLLKQFARAGGGTCTLCTPEDNIEAVVARIEARFGNPLIDNVTINGEAAAPGGATLFAGKPLSIWVKGSGPFTAKGLGPNGLVEWQSAPETADQSLASGYARARVAWLEDRLAIRPFEEAALQPEIVRVALAGGIASRFTAFVAVESSRTVTGERIEVVQPVELPHTWDQVADYGALPLLSAPMHYPAPAAPSGAGGAFASKSAARPRAPAPADRDLVADSLRMARSVARQFIHGNADTFAAPSPPPPSAAQPSKAAIDPILSLVQSQNADGSWGGDLARTVASLRQLIAAGHTRRSGLRKRAVEKAARWLEKRTEAEAIAALAELALAEQNAG